MRHVYFIKPIGMAGPIKIGQSATPGVRLQHLNCWAPFPLEIVAQIEGGRELEERFHAAFVDHHERLEWFTAHPDIISVIAAINDGAFDIDTLPYASGPIRGMRKRHETWAAIDYEYYGLLLQYYERDHSRKGWCNSVVQGSAFANLPHDKKLAKFADLNEFMSRPARGLAA